MKLLANDEKLTKIGRSYFDGDNLWCGLSGSGVVFNTTAAHMCITFTGDSSTRGQATEGLARVGVMVDGERVVDFMMSEPEKKVSLELDGEGHRIQVIKLSESAMSMIGIKEIEGDGEITAASLPKFKIEFVGDSITCGYGVDCEDPLIPFRTDTEDCTNAYAMRTAGKVSAAYSLCSYSGYGIISGYTNEDEKLLTHLVPKYYEKVGFSYASTDKGEKLENLAWDFSKYQPDLVVVNLGTNDHSYTKQIEERLADYRDTYVQFLKVINKNNPNAKILLTLGLMDALSFDNVEKVAKAFKAETGFNEIYTVPITIQQPEDGLCSDYHPTRVSHEKAAVTVSNKVKEIFGL